MAFAVTLKAVTFWLQKAFIGLPWELYNCGEHSMVVISPSALSNEAGVPLRVTDVTTRSGTETVPAGSVRIVFTLSGWGRVVTRQQSASVSTGTILTLPAALSCRELPAGWIRTVTMHLHPEYLSEQVRWLGDRHPLVHQLRNALSGDAGMQLLQFPRAGMDDLAPRLVQLAHLPQRPEQEFALLSLTSSIFDAVGRLAGTAGARRTSMPNGVARPRDEVIAAVAAMRQDLGRVWRIDELATRVALSPSQLSRLFRTQTGISPAAYLARLRADRMAELLAATSMSVGEAATLVGWAEPSVGSRAFKRRYGVSPSEYAARTRQRPLWAAS